MNRRKIIPIVEGHGEERAVPELLKRWLRYRRLQQYFDVPAYAINTKGCGKLKAPYNKERHLGIEHYISAAMNGEPAAILILLDADDECRNRRAGDGLGPELLARAKAVVPHIPIAVVVANPEYEAWFLASLTKIRSAGLLPNHSQRIPGELRPEAHRGCKELIGDLMCCVYEETVHQRILTQALTFSPRAQYRSPSYGKLLRDLERITQEARKIRPAN